jgi:hypothetical protein
MLCDSDQPAKANLGRNCRAQLRIPRGALRRVLCGALQRICGSLLLPIARHPL